MNELRKLTKEKKELLKQLYDAVNELTTVVNHGDTTSDAFRIRAIAVATINNSIYAKDCEIHNEIHNMTKNV